MPIKPKSRVLYLGVASGTSCSHVSDIVGDDGHIWALDFAPRALSDLLDKLSRFRENVSPILGDARDPGRYAMLVPKIDVIFADVAQPDQAKIAVKNADFFLKRKGWVMLSIKSRSIDVRGSPERIFNTQVMILEQGGLHVKELIPLDPFEKDHAIAVAQFI
jgi:fibrillarin-like pre-rRNA processing protein